MCHKTKAGTLTALRACDSTVNLPCRIYDTPPWAKQSPSLEAPPYVLVPDEGVAFSDGSRFMTPPDDESAAFALLSCLIYRGLFIGHPTGVIWLAKNQILYFRQRVIKSFPGRRAVKKEC